jgi:uncharacterized membrane protein
MVLMALDHVRDFFSNVTFDPLDLDKTSAALFLTRWVTHYCAPVFTFLAGTGAFLASTRGKTRSELSWFLFSRGLWLVFLELTWIQVLGWNFSFDFHNLGMGTLWSIGWSMVVLAALVRLPTSAITIFGVAMIATHNAFDGITPESLGSWGWLWVILHVPQTLNPATGFAIYFGYPLVPWIGVMAAGYGFGAMLLWDAGRRRKWLFGLGASLIATFVILRFSNGYGDLHRWQVRGTFLRTFFSFVACQKYPPSLLYLLMTLGPAMVVLSFLDHETPRVLRPVLVFGRVPLFYYLLHIPLIHGLAALASYVRFGDADWLFHTPFVRGTLPSAEKGYGLPVIYFVWVGVVLVLYPACKRFAEFKRRRKDVWLSYL